MLECFIMTLGNNIRKYRKESRLTQVEFAKRLGVVQTHIHRWEADKVIPSIETLKKLAKTLNVSTDNLLFSERERKKFKPSDKELFEKLKDIDKLSSAEKETIIHLIETFQQSRKNNK